MKVFIDHIGYLCRGNKSFVAEDGPFTEFEIQDMSRVNKETLGEYEDWETVYTGKLEKSITEMGTFLTGDFSSLTTPGIYRVVLDRKDAYSYQFTISDGIHYPLIRSFLDFTHNWRSGNFSNAWHGPSHLDDAIRADTREHHDVSGGWYDAGDTRKWMTMSNLPVIAFLDIAERLGISWNHFTPGNSPFGSTHNRTRKTY